MTGVGFWFDTSSQDQIKGRQGIVAEADVESVSVIIAVTKNTEDRTCNLVLVRRKLNKLTNWRRTMVIRRLVLVPIYLLKVSKQLNKNIIFESNKQEI